MASKGGTTGRVLIVDDDKLIRLGMQLIIEADGYQVKTAENGYAALDGIRENVPDIVLLDVIMPGIDGYEVCRRLKNDPVSSRIPVIFLSGCSSPEEKVAAFEAGAVDYIVKPCNKIELLIRLRTHLAFQGMHNRLVKEVRTQTGELAEKTNELHELNIVLQRLLREIEKEKEKTGRIVRMNIERLILPDLERMAKAPFDKRCLLLGTIRNNLLGIARPLAGRHDIYSVLTPAELRVLNLVQQGYTGKEIAEILNISLQTVATHRKKIRRKLNISGKKINLASFVSEP